MKDDSMRCLSIRQPWASLIANGRKTLELRSWSTPYRGPVLILAGSRAWKGDHGFELGPMGVSLCVVDLVDVRPVQPGDEVGACIVPPEGFDVAFVLANPRPVRQVAVGGKLNLYRPEPALLQAVGLL